MTHSGGSAYLEGCDWLAVPVHLTCWQEPAGLPGASVIFHFPRVLAVFVLQVLCIDGYGTFYRAVRVSRHLFSVNLHVYVLVWLYTLNNTIGLSYEYGVNSILRTPE